MRKDLCINSLSLSYYESLSLVKKPADPSYLWDISAHSVYITVIGAGNSVYLKPGATASHNGAMSSLVNAHIIICKHNSKSTLRGKTALVDCISTTITKYKNELLMGENTTAIVRLLDLLNFTKENALASCSLTYTVPIRFTETTTDAYSPAAAAAFSETTSSTTSVVPYTTTTSYTNVAPLNEAYVKSKKARRREKVAKELANRKVEQDELDAAIALSLDELISAAVQDECTTADAEQEKYALFFAEELSRRVN